MKDQISIYNYEAFYLDYLEGNLDENATLVLFAFLTENPELKVENLGPELIDDSNILGMDFKNILKQNLDSSAVTLHTIDYFLIAEKEGQTSPAKIAEIDSFISENSGFKVDRKIYALSALVANKTIVFKDKNTLKHRKSFVLWPYLSFLAAASIVFLIWLIPNSAYDGEISTAAQIPEIKIKSKISNTTSGFIQKEKIDFKDVSTVLAAKKMRASTNKLNKKDLILTSISGNLRLKKVGEFAFNFLEKTDFASSLEDKAPASSAYRPVEISEVDYTSLSMTNPIKPLTNKLSDLIKTQVDYKTGKNDLSRRKGFYLKIGTLEISQNKRVITQ